MWARHTSHSTISGASTICSGWTMSSTRMTAGAGQHATHTLSRRILPIANAYEFLAMCAHCQSLILSAGCIVAMGQMHFKCNTAIAPCAELPSLQLILVRRVCSLMQALRRQNLPLHNWCGCRHSAVQATHLQTEQAAGAVE